MMMSDKELAAIWAKAHASSARRQKLEKAAPNLLKTLEWVHDWLSSFSMPPTSTIQEKQEAMAVIEKAISGAKDV